MSKLGKYLVDEVLKDFQSVENSFFDETSSTNSSKPITESGAIDAGEPEVGYYADGTKRILNGAKPENWFKQGGYIQLEKPKSDYMRGKGKGKDTESQFRKVIYKVKGVTEPVKGKSLTPYQVDKWNNVTPKAIKPKNPRYWELEKVDEDINVPISVGDTVLGGKFKNKKIIVKDIGKNEKGDITINGKPLLKYRLIDEAYEEVIAELRKDPQFEEFLSEIPMSDLHQIDKYADKQLDPLDVVITDKHFLDRLVDPRNKKPISAAELTGFFKRLARKKDQFVDFLKKYGEIVAKDNRTKINIPFMKQANKAIAKTIMRKDDFKTPSPELKFEGDKIVGGLSSGMNLSDIAKKHGVSLDSIKSELIKGIKVELEHTTTKEIAKEIAMDHLTEDPKYYTKLASIENPKTENLMIGYPDQKWMDNHKKRIDKLRTKLDAERQNEYTMMRSHIQPSAPVRGLYSDELDESNPSDVIKDLDKVKNDLLKKVDVLIAKKKKLYSNVDIESPMSSEEKQLDKEIADIFSQINKLVLQKRTLKKENKSKLNEYTKGQIFGGKIKIGGESVPVEVELLGADNKKKVFITKIIGIDKKWWNKIPNDGILEIPARIFRTPGGGWFKVKTPKVFEDVTEPVKDYVVVYAGRFQPFHKGHFATYQYLVKKFGKDKVYIGTSDKTDNVKSPFNFNEKKLIMVGMFGIPVNKIVQIKNPYAPVEILKNFDENTTGFITVVGGKDEARLGGKYFTPYKGTIDSGYNDKGYVYVSPSLSNVSGTDVRNWLGSGDIESRKQLFTKAYPKFNEKIFNLIVKKLDSLKEGVIAKNLIKEGGDYVICMECGERMKQIQYRHLKYKHGMDLKEYKVKHPNAILVSEAAKNMGDKNPMKNEETLKKHKKSVNTLQYKEKISEALKGKNVGNVRTDNIERNKSIEFKKKISEGVKKSYIDNPKLKQQRSDIGKKYGFGNVSTLEKMYESGKWSRPENKDKFQLYTETVRRLSDINYQKFFDKIPNAKKRSSDFHLDHKYSIREAFDNNIPIEVVSHYKNLEVIGGRLNESKGSKSSIKLNELINDIQNSLNPLDTRTLLLCGGAYGHMNHPFDIDVNLTFGQLKDIVKKALNGELELTREKTDGQALAVSWVNGRLVAARNKSHLKNKGKDAMDINSVASKFANRGGLTDAYNYAMKDLSVAIDKLTEKQKDKIFGGGSKFMNLEVIYPTSVNVIPYGQALLVFHGTFEYDEAGNIIGEDQSAGRILAGMIKQINQNVQSKYTIQGPPVVKLPKNTELSKSQSKFLGMISKLQSEYGLKDNQGVAEYHQKWWEEFVNKNASTLDEQQKIGLVKRWAFMDKSFRIKDIQDEKIRKWAEGVDKTDVQKISKDNLMKFEKIFLGVGAEVLSFMSSVLTVNPDSAKRTMVGRLEKTIKDVEASGDEKQVNKLKLELQRLQDLGGFEKIVPNEGIVFQYPSGPNGHTMKLTGSFAPLNQILGIFFDNK